MGGGSSPPGVWEGLKAGKQILDVISAGSHILECGWGKKLHCKFYLVGSKITSTAALGAE